MPLNYSLAGPQFDGLQALQAYGQGQQMAQQQQDWQRKQGDYRRQDEARGALSALIQTGTQATAPAPRVGGSLINGAPPREDLERPNRNDAFNRLAAADPNAALSYQNHERTATKEQLAIFHDVNGQALQILGGVNDQESYDLAKRRAGALYQRYGLSLDEYELPDQYSPEVVNGLRMQALDTDKQLTQLRQDRRLDADIADDDADNSRADRNTESMIEDRGARRNITIRGQDLGDARGRRGQDLSHEDRVRRENLRPAPGARRGGRMVTPNNPASMIPGASPDLPVTVQTVGEAKLLAPGTFFRTPRGTIMRVPK